MLIFVPHYLCFALASFVLFADLLTCACFTFSIKDLSYTNDLLKISLKPLWSSSYKGKKKSLWVFFLSLSFIYVIVPAKAQQCPMMIDAFMID